MTIYMCRTCPSTIVGSRDKATRAGWEVSKRGAQCKVCVSLKRTVASG